MKKPNLIIENLKAIQEECTASEDAVSYVNSEDAGTLKAAIEALEFRENYDKFWEEVKSAGKAGKEVEIHHSGRVFRIREVAQ